MTVNPAAVVLLVLGFVAVVVGVKGTQKKAGALLTGRGATSTTSAPPPSDPMGTHPAAGAGAAAMGAI